MIWRRSSTDLNGPFLARESNYVQPPHLASQYNAEDMQRHFVWTIKGPRPPKGEVYCSTEGPKVREEISEDVAGNAGAE